MSASIEENRSVECPRCQRAHVTAVLLAADLEAEPDLRTVLREPQAYQLTCPVCQQSFLRPIPLLVMGIAHAAPVILGCPEPLLVHHDPLSTFRDVAERARRTVEAKGRTLPGPVLIVPFDVLALALRRPIDQDVANPEGAAREIAGAYGPDAADRHLIFLSDVLGSSEERRINAAIDAFDQILERDSYEAVLTEHPEILEPTVIDRVARRAARAGGDDEPGRKVAAAHAQLLRDTTANGVDDVWDTYQAALAKIVGEAFSAPAVALRAQFDHAFSRGRLGEAAAIGEQLIALADATAGDDAALMPLVRTAAAYHQRDDGDRASHRERCYELYSRALKILRAQAEAGRSDEGLELETLLNLGAAVAGRVHGDLAANQELAIALAQEVIDRTSPQSDRRAWAIAHTNLGHSLLVREQVVEEFDVDEDEAQAFATEQLTQAIAHLEEALRWRSFDADPLDWAYTQINLGLAFERRADPPEADLTLAIEHFGESIRGFGASGETSHQAQALGNRAAAARRLAALQVPADRHEALLRQAEVDSAAAIDLTGRDTPGTDAGRRWSQRAHVLADLHGHSPETTAAFREALDRLTPTSSPHGCRDTARTFAQLAEAAGDHEAAAEAWRLSALGAAAAIESRVTRGGRFNEVRDAGNAFRWAANASIRVGELRGAVELLELGRARELGAWLDRDVVDLQPVLDAAPELHDAFVDLRRRIEESDRDAVPVSDPERIVVAERLEQVIAEIRQLPGQEAFLERPTIDVIANGLADDEAIAYPVTSPGGSAWLIVQPTPQEQAAISMISLPDLTSSAIRESLLRLNGTTQEGEGFLVEQRRGGPELDRAIRDASALLGPALMRPLAHRLEGLSVKSVIIVPLGLLGWIPLHAMEWDDGVRERCLLDATEVALAPSAYALHVCRARAGRGSDFQRLVAVGNPLPSSEPLDGAELEADMVGNTVPADDTLLLLREAATKEAVLAALPSASHIHLACHGKATGDPRAFDAALLFDHDRPVSAAEIIELDLSEVRVVVASACVTAVIPSYESVDESLSLSTIFLGAGAAGAIASLWPVDDYATALLMSRFYEELVAGPERPARALRKAQLWLRDLSANEEQQYSALRSSLADHRARPCLRGADAAGSAGYQDPSAWAGFTLNGA